MVKRMDPVSINKKKKISKDNTTETAKGIKDPTEYHHNSITFL